MAATTLEEPRRPDDLNDPVKLAILNEEVREYVRDKTSFKGQPNSAYRLILGQCNPSIKCAMNLIGAMRHSGRMVIRLPCSNPSQK
jgi:hypothetical protein